MKLADKFGYTAVKAAELIQKGELESPTEAWEKAGYQVLEKKVYVEKPCPKNAFLGLCEEGLVKGVPRGEYTKSEKNKNYALKAFEKLQEDPSVKNNIKKFWEIVGPKPAISHNYQLNVVIQLMEHNLLTTKKSNARNLRDQFQGFSKEDFDSCTASSKINNARRALENLRVVIEPELKKWNQNLNGKISEAKQRWGGGVDWTDWAWLMFTLAPLGSKGSSRPGKPIGASKFTQLTVNISKQRLYAGLNLKSNPDRSRLQESLLNPVNEELLNRIVHTLSGRKWIVTEFDEYFGRKQARYYSEDEMRGKLLNPRLEWINASFSRHDKIVSKRGVVAEIVKVFEELYNLFALATRASTINQPKPKSPPRTSRVLVDEPIINVTSDEENVQSALDFLAKLKLKEKPSAINAPKKTDSYPVERTVLPLRLSPRTFQHPTGPIVYWLDSKYKEGKVESRTQLLVQLRRKLDQIAIALGQIPDFFQIMVTSPLSDARYTKSNRILVNLLRYEKNRKMEFWLFAIAREVAYLRYRRLSYRHMNFMRKVLLACLSRVRVNDSIS